MKILALATMIAFTATAGISETPKAEDDTCKSMGEIAYTMMTIRQSGLPLSEVMGRINEIGFSEAFALFARDVALHAYGAAVFDAPTMKEDAAVRFRNDYETACYLSGLDQ